MDRAVRHTQLPHHPGRLTQAMPHEKPHTKPPIYGVAVDQGSGLGEAIRQARGENAQDDDLFAFKKTVVEVLSPATSMLLVDAAYGRELLPHFEPACDKLLAYEADVYRMSDEDRITLLPDNLTIGDFEALGVSRLKFFLYYAPRSTSGLNERKQQIVRDIGRECAERGIEFLFEPLVYDEQLTDAASPEFAALKPDLVREATATFADPQFNVDILKVEIPVNLSFVEGFGQASMSREAALKAFQDAAGAAGDIPIVYLSAGVSFDWFEASLRLAREAGVQAAGFMCGRAVWSDGIAKFGEYGRDGLSQWLWTEGRTRVEKLKAAL